MNMNRRNIIRFRKLIDKIPAGSAIRAMRLAAKLSIEKAGEVFGGGAVAFSKYENDDLIPDTAMVGLIKMAIEDPTFAQRLEHVRPREVQLVVWKPTLNVAVPKIAAGGWFDSNAFPEPSEIRLTKEYRTESCLVH